MQNPFEQTSRPSRGPALAAALGGVLALALAAAIVWASLTLPIGESFARIVADPWGVVTLFDLYTGFLFAIALVFLVETRIATALAVAAAILVLGNVATALWVAIRWRRIAGAFRSIGS